jgi:uroporphyrinogen-III synthase
MTAPLIVLRPEPGASATVARARDMGLVAVAHPLFETQPEVWDAAEPEAYTGILMTSANAARHAGPGLARYLHLPLFAVGLATASAAEAAGFASVASGDSDVARLLAKVATLGKHKLLHLSGEDVTEVAAIGIEIDRRIVYRAEPLIPDGAMLETLAIGGVALVHSPRAAARLAEIAPERAVLSLAAISPRTAEAAGTGWQRVAVAAVPRDEALLDIAASLARTTHTGF